MIEKNIFRPLPVLKKAGVPGEGVGGMEEVIHFKHLGRIIGGSSLATSSTCLLIFLTTNS
jgi:hypothetical protein